MITLGEKLALGSLEKVTGLAKQLPKGLGVTQESSSRPCRLGAASLRESPSVSSWKK